MDPASVHRWFKMALERARLPPTIKLHELRHSAADNLWRQTALAQMQVVRSQEEDSAWPELLAHSNAR
jgi:hypothetical protein